MDYPFQGSCWLFSDDNRMESPDQMGVDTFLPVHNDKHSGDGSPTSRCYVVAWSETVGHCKAPSSYKTLNQLPLVSTPQRQGGIDICKAQCDSESRCHAFGADYPFAGSCKFFTDFEGTNRGDGGETGRCYVHETFAPVCTGDVTTSLTVPLSCEFSGFNIPAVQVLWQETDGDCRYSGDQETHGFYMQLEGRPNKEACLRYCTSDPLCDAVDMDEPFLNPATGTGTCWLFRNEVGAAGQHVGDQRGQSKCYVPDWTETAGVCRYSAGAAVGGQTIYRTDTGLGSVEDCKASCEADAQCHAYDNDYPFQGTCRYFQNQHSDAHAGDGTRTSQCWTRPKPLNPTTNQRECRDATCPPNVYLTSRCASDTCSQATGCTPPNNVAMPRCSTYVTTNCCCD